MKPVENEGEEPKSFYFHMFGREPTFERYIPGELVFFMPAPTQPSAATTKSESNLRGGIFLDYYVSYDGLFTGQYICVTLENLAGKSLHRKINKAHFNLKLNRIEVVKRPANQKALCSRSRTNTTSLTSP